MASPTVRVWWASITADTVGYSLGGNVPALENMPRHNSDGISGMHVYVPWWELDKEE